ncbi:carbohydrate ABC transporter permease [Microbacterium binotii]|uniref:carbohydrate ABC transporter permease n=1 Tax=Microbacterium binotii TaxID=462710 RepID=UPI001F377F39|nr:carbohydrate ABC transporter permease [Microbacterium binotii]UIN29704.1 carbohydrate ABC transporter permease [Microbacterium binotii]
MRTSRLGSALLYLFITVVCVAMLIPFVLVFFGAFKTQGEFTADPGAWLPESFGNLANFTTLFERGFGRYFLNGVIVSALVVAGNLVFSSLAGYTLAKLHFRGRGFVFALVLATMMVPIVAIFVPQFMVAVQLGLVDTLFGIALPMLVLPIAVFVVRQFAHSIPEDLMEAARLDGAGELRIFGQIFLPLLAPALATVSVLTFLASWNAFIWPLVMAQSQSTYTLPVGLAVAAQANRTTEFGVLLAGAVVVLLPVLILFLFLQKYFVQGIAATGLK